MEILTTIKDLSTDIKNLDVSPDTPVIVTVLGADTTNQPLKADREKGRWAKIAREISRKSPLRGKGDSLRKASRTFRENFCFREPPHFKLSEDNE